MKHIGLKKKKVTLWVSVGLGFVVLVVFIFVVFRVSTSQNAHDFESCKNAGGTILESYPERCLIHGESYVNEGQASDTSGYVGLSEQSAMDKAKAANVPHRVVERDNESLAVTMDYVVGRLNFHVRDGHVYRVEIEGVE